MKVRGLAEGRLDPREIAGFSSPSLNLRLRLPSNGWRGHNLKILAKKSRHPSPATPPSLKPLPSPWGAWDQWSRGGGGVCRGFTFCAPHILCLMYWGSSDFYTVWLVDELGSSRIFAACTVYSVWFTVYTKCMPCPNIKSLPCGTFDVESVPYRQPWSTLLCLDFFALTGHLPWVALTVVAVCFGLSGNSKSAIESAMVKHDEKISCQGY